MLVGSVPLPGVGRGNGHGKKFEAMCLRGREPTLSRVPCELQRLCAPRRMMSQGEPAVVGSGASQQSKTAPKWRLQPGKAGLGFSLAQTSSRLLCSRSSALARSFRLAPFVSWALGCTPSAAQSSSARCRQQLPNRGRPRSARPRSVRDRALELPPSSSSRLCSRSRG